MASTVEDPTFVIPFMPTLLHLASVQVAIPLYNDFGAETLNTVFAEIQQGDSVEMNEASQNNREANYNKAKENLLLIPARLRSGVMKTVNGLHCSSESWQNRHRMFFSIENGERIIYRRSDGTINELKTAEQFVQNVNIGVKKRFYIACMYSFEMCIPTLAKELVSSGKAKYVNTKRGSITRFAVRWLKDGCRDPWIQVIPEYLKRAKYDFVSRNPRVSSFFASLPPGGRNIFLSCLLQSSLDDMRFCLRSATTEEIEEFLQMNAQRYLCLHLNWPMQTLFLETTEKLWSYINEHDFITVLIRIFWCKEERTDFDYVELFRAFWNRSPIHLKESARCYANFREKIDSCLNESDRKRKIVDDEGINPETKKVSADTNGI